MITLRKGVSTLVLEAIKSGCKNRAEIQEATGFSQQKVNGAISRLKSLGFEIESVLTITHEPEYEITNSANVDIVEILMANPGEEFTSQELKDLTGINMIFSALDYAARIGVNITVETRGKNTFWKYDEANNDN